MSKTYTIDELHEIARPSPQEQRDEDERMATFKEDAFAGFREALGLPANAKDAKIVYAALCEV